MNYTQTQTRTASGLLLAGALAGPLYLTVGLVQAMTRQGFDVTRHPLSLLSNGDLGWIQTANFWITGALVIAGAIGLLLSRSQGPVSSCLLVLYGLGMCAAGTFKADPGAGFPPGTPELVEISTSGILHFATGGIGFLGFIAAAITIGVRALRNGAPSWGWFSIVTGVVFLAAFVGIGSGAGNSITILGFYLAVILGFAWLTALFTRARRASRSGASASVTSAKSA